MQRASSHRRVDLAKAAGRAVLLAWLIAVGVSAQPAHAFKKAIWGPATVNGQSQFPIYKDLGVDLYETSLDWSSVAPVRPAAPSDPNDPAYRWSPDLDLAVREANAYGIGVLVMVLRTPAWANGGKTPKDPPTDPQAYASFVEALARRYPTIRHFMVWGEPNGGAQYLIHPGSSPNYYSKHHKRSKRLPSLNSVQRADARGYARLVDATYGRLKALNRQNIVIGGNTVTSGGLDPFNWAKYMRLPGGKPPRMDLFGHNPFGTRRPNLAKDQIVAGTADMSDLDVFTPWVKRWISRGGRNRKLRLFISEYTAPTDVPSYEFPYHVTRAVQAKWLTAAMRIARRSHSIYGLGWIGLRDLAVRADGQESRTGLIDAQDRRKPSYYAYKRG